MGFNSGFKGLRVNLENIHNILSCTENRKIETVIRLEIGKKSAVFVYSNPS